MSARYCCSPSTQLSYTPVQSCCNPCAGTPTTTGPSFSCSCCQSPCTCDSEMSKIASFALGRSECCKPPPIKQRPCCPPQPPPCPRPIRPAVRNINCCPPPVMIPCCPPRTSQNGKTPAERLKNVDVLEELCYYIQSGPDPCCPPCYQISNCCGETEIICCPQPQCPPPPNPVKYSRRQRFAFQNERCQPPWPFDGVDTNPCPCPPPICPPPCPDPCPPPK